MSKGFISTAFSKNHQFDDIKNNWTKDEEAFLNY